MATTTYTSIKAVAHAPDGITYLGTTATPGVIKKIAADGSVVNAAWYTAGTGLFICDLECDSTGNVFVYLGHASYNLSKVIKITPAGSVSTVISAVEWQGDQILVADDDNTLWLRSTGWGAVWRATVSGAAVTHTIAAGGGGRDIALSSDGICYISSYTGTNADKIWKVSANGATVTETWASITSPYGLGVDSSGNVLVSSSSAYLQKVSSAGSVTSTWANTGSVRGVAVAPSGNIYTQINSNGNIARVSSDGATVNTTWKTGLTAVNLPMISVDPQNIVWVVVSSSAYRVDDDYTPPGEPSTISSYVDVSYYTGAPIDEIVFTITGDPTPTVTCSELPPGLTFTDNLNGTATISGAPYVGGSTTITVTADNGIGDPAVTTFTITVKLVGITFSGPKHKQTPMQHINPEDVPVHGKWGG